MSAAVNHLVRRLGFRPTLRTDLQFIPGARPGVIVIVDPVRNQRWELTDVEYRIASAMDGNRDIGSLTRMVKPSMSSITRHQIEQLAIKLADMELLSNFSSKLAPEAPMAPVIPLVVPQAKSRAKPANDDDLDDGPTMLTDQDAIEAALGAGTDDDLEQSTGLDRVERFEHNTAGLTSDTPVSRNEFDDAMSGSTEVVSASLFEDVVERGPHGDEHVISSSRRERRDTGLSPPPYMDPPPPIGVARPTPPPNAPYMRPPLPTPLPFLAPVPASEPAPEPVPVPEPAPAPAPAPAAPDPAPAAKSDATKDAKDNKDNKDKKDWDLEKPRWYRNKKKRRRVIFLGILVVLAVLSIIPYPLYVTEPCVVSPIDRAEVRAQIDGIIAQVFVREGDLVEIGTPLVRLDDRDLTHKLRQAQAESDRQKANLDKVKAGSRPQEISRAQALVITRAQDAKFAEIEARRKQKLFNEGVASATARDEAQRDLAVKRSSLSEAQAELRLIQAGSRTEEVAVAEAEMRKVEAEIDFLKKQSDSLLVRSPIAGRVLTPRFHERLHAKVAAGDFVCEVGNGDSVRIDILVPEGEADVVQVGHPVTVKVKSYPLESFHGRVSAIAPSVEEVDKQRIIRVETVIENDTNVLRPGMTGYAEIDTGERPLIVRISRRALRWLRVRFLL